MILKKIYPAYFFFFFLLFFVFGFVFLQITTAQVFLSEPEVRIGKISVQGNLKTKREVIVRELEFDSGDLVTIQDLESARKRIENLNIFNRVIFNFQDTGDQKDLVIMVWERWYIYPMPFFNINEHDWDKLSYGFGILHSNFRGRAETLWLSGWLGYNPGMNLSYSNRWFGGKHRLYTTINLKSQRVESLTLSIPDLEEHHRSLAVVFGKKYGIYWYSDVELAFKFIEADKQIAWQSKERRDKIFSPVFRIQRDTRDLWEYPKNGNKIIFSFSRSFLLNGSAGFNKWSFDWREYRTWLGMTLAGRFHGELTQHPLPIYERLFIGYGERIRGYFEKIYEGENRILGSVEFRLPLVKVRYFQVPTDSWIASYFQQLKLGIYLTVFRDAGAVWYQKEKLHPKHWCAGTGVGLNFILPYSNILRLEYAFDETGKSEYIIDVNAAF